MKHRRAATVLTVIAGLIIGGIPAWAGLLVSIIIPTTGNRVTFTPSANIEIYNDEACTDPCTSHAWGTIYNGTSKNKTVWVKNVGNMDLTLTLSTSDWTPSQASSDLTLTWNYDGSALAPNQILQVMLTLFAAATGGTTSFSFNIIITGEG